MNTQFKSYVIICLLLLAGTGYAQNVDNTRMKRDIEIAENILSTLIGQETNARMGNSVEGTYIEGNGVLFTIGGSSFYNLSYGRDLFVNGYAIATTPASAPSAKGQGQQATKNTINRDSLNNKFYTDIKKVMQTFITDYAYLISQLPPTEKVLIRYGQNGQFSNFVIAGTPKAWGFNADQEEDSTPPKELTAEITKTNLDEFRSGKLTKAQLEQRIKFTEKTSTAKKDAELELLSSIFNRLYQNDLSETFRIFGNPSYEKIEGIGAVFNLNFGRFFGAGGVYTLYTKDRLGARSGNKIETTTSKPEPTETENLQRIKADYPKFMEGFKQNMIEYGRTVQNLAANELLIFKLNLPECADCGIPESVEVSVKKSVLEDYNKNKMTLEQAIQQVKTKTTTD